MESIIGRGHTYQDAAVELRASVEDIESWVNDDSVPGPEDLGPLAGYLGVDPSALQGLILRSQMRQAQRRIHGMRAS
jgi:hypothetical protein